MERENQTLAKKLEKNVLLSPESRMGARVLPIYLELIILQRGC